MSKVIQVPHNFTPRDYQLELFRALDGEEGKPDSRKTRAILVWTRQIGKDTSCFAYMAKEACRKPSNYFYIFPTREMAKKSVWEKVLDDGTKLRDMIPKELVEGVSNQELLIRLTNGSTIRFIGLDKDPDAGRGISPQGVVFSEFAYSDPEAYKAVLPAMRRKDCWLIINSTPNGRNYFHDIYTKTAGHERWFRSLKQSLYPDREGYVHVHTPEEFEEMLSSGETTQEDLEREYGCQFSSGLKGSYFHDQIARARESSRIGQFLYDETFPVDTFWDIGIDDTDVCWFGQRIGNTVTFIDYFEKSGQGTDDIAKMLSDKGYEYGTHYLPHDAGHRKKTQVITTTEDELRASLLNFDVTGDTFVLSRNPSKQAGILALRKRLPLYRFNEDTCHIGIEHVELYHRKFDRVRKVYLQDPVHDQHSHAADALRMEAESNDSRNDPFLQQNLGTGISFDFDPFA